MKSATRALLLLARLATPRLASSRRAAGCGDLAEPSLYFCSPEKLMSHLLVINGRVNYLAVPDSNGIVGRYRLDRGLLPTFYPTRSIYTARGKP